MFMGALEVRETCLLPPDVFVGDSLSLSPSLFKLVIVALMEHMVAKTPSSAQR